MSTSYPIRERLVERNERKGQRAYMYGPGNPFNALKQRHVSSTRTGP